MIQDGTTRVAAARGLAALIVLGLSLRIQLTVIGPLLPRIQDDIGISHTAAGLLTGLPVLCMGLAAFFSVRVVGWLGPAVAIGGAVAIVALAGAVRAVASDPTPVFGATLILGLGMGIGGASAPVFVKDRFHGRPATATGLHVTAIILGSAVAASTAVPLADALGSWRWPLALWSAVTGVAAISWFLLTVDRGPRPAVPTAPRRLPYRSGIAWLLVAVFCLQSLVFWGLSTWLPDAYVERGWDPAAAANLVASLIIVGLPTSLATGWLADRFGSRRHYLVGSAVVALVCCIGFVVLPDAGLLWAALIGVPLGALFPIAMTLPLDASARPADVGGLTAMMLGVGYIAAAAGPVAMGAARDVLGSFTASLSLLVVAAAALTVLSILMTDARLASGRTAGMPAEREPVRGQGPAVEEL